MAAALQELRHQQSNTEEIRTSLTFTWKRGSKVHKSALCERERFIQRLSP